MRMKRRNRKRAGKRIGKVVNKTADVGVREQFYYKKQKHSRRGEQEMKKKVLVSVVASLMLVGALVGGTLAYLTDTTDKVTNTFTVGNVDIDLAETATDFKMVPGSPITKDPMVTVKGGSEACWLFVKFEKSSNLDTFIAYEKADGWNEWTVDEEKAVYYREVAANSADQEFPVLKNNEVSVKASVTKEQMDEIVKDPTNAPTLTFTAYAVQKANVTTVQEAWNVLNPAPATTTP